jgi:hypothetical protein
VSSEARKTDYLRDVSEPACSEKAQLLKDYQERTAAFSQAVDDLQKLRGTTPLSEYHRVQRLSDEARIKAEQARLALEEHVAKHRC